MAYDILYDGTSAHSNITATIMVESEADLSDLPNTIEVGSIAFAAGFGSMWQKGLDGTWEVIV